MTYTSRTSGGLIKRGIHFSQDEMVDIDRIAAERHLSRAATVRDLVRRGVEHWRAEQRLLRSLKASRVG